MIRILKRPLTRSALSALALAGWLLTGCTLPTADREPDTPELRFDRTENLTKAKTQWLEWLTRMQTAPVIMLGEQHDAPEHHAWEADTVRELTQRKRLAALVLEMADAGATTHGLPANASEADVLNVAMFGLTALEWRDAHPDLKGNVRDYATVNELICLSNMENLNAVFIGEGLPQHERLVRLNRIAIQQMQILEDVNKKYLK